MEHLSRRSTNNIELLCIVADPTPLGATTTARRIFELAKQLPTTVKDIGVILNRANSTENNRELEKIEVFGCVPYDKVVFDTSMEGKTIFDIELNSPAFLAVQKVVEYKLHLT
jgi:CO dehydrogenase maturation factor